MKTGRMTRLVSRLAALIALASVASGCGLLAGPSEREVVASMIDQAATVNQSLGATVTYAATSRSTMSPEFRVLAEKLDSDLSDFNDLTDDLRSTDEIADAAKGFAQATNLATGLLGDGSIDVASDVSRTQVEPKYTTLQALLTARQEEIGEPGSGARWWLWFVAIPLIGFAGYVFIQRRRPTLEHLLAQPNAVPQPEIRSEPEGKENRRKRLASQDQSGEADVSLIAGLELPPPIGDTIYRPAGPEQPEQDHRASASPASPGEPAMSNHLDPRSHAGPLRNPEALHSVRGGLRTVELRGIIDAALATMVDAGWEVAIECPDVSVLVDPLRMRRLLSNLLLSATAHGAEHIGLVAVIVEDRVEVNVGHDGSLLEGVTDTTETPRDVDHQLTVARQLLAGMNARARWSNWRGVSLYTIELVRGPDEVAGHDVAAAASVD